MRLRRNDPSSILKSESVKISSAVQPRSPAFETVISFAIDQCFSTFFLRKSCLWSESCLCGFVRIPKASPEFSWEFFLYEDVHVSRLSSGCFHVVIYCFFGIELYFFERLELLYRIVRFNFFYLLLILKYYLIESRWFSFKILLYWIKWK